MADILLLEDEEPLRRLLVELLEEEGHAVTARGNGMITQSGELGRVDLMITDLIMPEVDGLESIRAVKKSSPEVKIIAISGGGRTVTKDYLPVARDFGATVIMQKPFTPDALIEKVRQLLGGESETGFEAVA